jgi:hypothetical protein
MELNAEVKVLLEENEVLEVVTVGEGEQKPRLRVRCSLTNHEMVPTKQAIETHLKSKKFLKAKEWYCYDYSKYEPYIVAHRRKPKCLYCNVTNTVLNRIPAEVERHFNGKKFQRLKEHLTFSVSKNDKEKEDKENEFDANKFEFMNGQVIWSADEEDEEETSKTARNDDDKNDDTVETTSSDLDDDEKEEEEHDDDDLEDLYPAEDLSRANDEAFFDAKKKEVEKKTKKVEYITYSYAYKIKTWDLTLLFFNI